VARGRRGEARHTGYDELHHELGEHIRDLVVDKLAEKAAKRERRTAKGRMQAEDIELLSDQLSALDLWTRVPPGERRTLITREELAAAAVRKENQRGCK